MGYFRLRFVTWRVPAGRDPAVTRLHQFVTVALQRRQRRPARGRPPRDQAAAAFPGEVLAPARIDTAWSW
ncbi:MAG: hypothetical protein M3Q65_18985 [Chloroflexota bacterium]|nr:hypothetical protein [Chloroflexota bacterium]